MFGLMRGVHGPTTRDDRRRRRMHYCGSCKALGRMYGAKSRLLLNFDSVFLAELLLALSDDPESWRQFPAGIQSYNCLSLPPDEESTPLALRYAATAALTLAEFKTEDAIADSGRRRWTLLRRLYSSSFRAAERRLRYWDFPVEHLRELLFSQQKREKAIDACIDSVAEPTAGATALFFEHGAALIGKPALATPMRELGYDFGKLIYLLDAWEDYERDLAEARFNAFRAASWSRESGLGEMRAIETSLCERIARLPLTEARSAEFQGRLKHNLAARTGVQLPVLHGCRARSHEPLRTRWNTAVVIARNKLKGERAGVLAFTGVLMAAFFLPRETRDAANYKECLGLGMNLMAFGALAMAAGSPGPPGTPPVPGLGPGKSVGTPGGPSGCGSCLNTCSIFECCGEGCCDACCDIGSCCDCG